jgi:integrase
LHSRPDSKKDQYGKENESESSGACPTPEDIRKIIEYMPLNVRTLTVVLASSGMRFGETLQLTRGDIKLGLNPPTIHIPAKITKTKKKRTIFISSEAKDFLDQWLSYNKENCLFPFTEQSVLEVWALAAKKVASMR